MRTGNGYCNSYMMDNSNFDLIIPYDECASIWNRARGELKTDDAIDKVVRKLGLSYSQNKRRTIRAYFYKYREEVKK